jgi:hypothetical protein
MEPGDRKAGASARHLGLFVLGGSAVGAALGASGLVGDLGPGPDACSGTVYGFVIGAVLFALADRRRR